MPAPVDPPTMEELLDTALALHAAGLSILPLHDKEPYDPSKLPYRDSRSGTWVEYPRLRWKPYSARQATRGQVEGWFAPHLAPERQSNGVGYCSGSVSGGVQLLDFEDDNRFERWAADVGILRVYQLTVIRTGRGYNVVWKCAAPVTNPRLDPGLVEARGDHQYSAAPPSWHPKAERRYYLVHGDLCALPELTTEESEQLLEAARGEAAPVEYEAMPPMLNTPITPLNTNGVPSGQQLRTLYNTTYALVDELVRYGGRPASNGRWHCPSKEDHEHGDRDGSLDVSPSRRPDLYGAAICGCWQPRCRLWGGMGRIIASFDLMQVMEGVTRREAHRIAAERLGVAFDQALAERKLPIIIVSAYHRRTPWWEYSQPSSKEYDGMCIHLGWSQHSMPIA